VRRSDFFSITIFTFIFLFNIFFFSLSNILLFLFFYLASFYFYLKKIAQFSLLNINKIIVNLNIYKIKIEEKINFENLKLNV